MQRQAATGEEKAARTRAAVSDVEAHLRSMADTRSRLDEEGSQQEERRRALVSQMGEAARSLSGYRAEERRQNEGMVAALQEEKHYQEYWAGVSLRCLYKNFHQKLVRLVLFTL